MTYLIYIFRLKGPDMPVNRDAILKDCNTAERGYCVCLYVDSSPLRGHCQCPGMVCKSCNHYFLFDWIRSYLFGNISDNFSNESVFREI